MRELDRMGILREILEKDPGVKVLDYVLSHKEESLVHYHIEEETGLSYATVERVLAELHEKGIIKMEDIGKRTIYRLNKENKYVKVLKPLYSSENDHGGD